MTFDLKAQPASISSAICGLRRIIIVFSSLTNKMEMEMEPFMSKTHQIHYGNSEVWHGVPYLGLLQAL